MAQSALLPKSAASLSSKHPLPRLLASASPASQSIRGRTPGIRAKVILEPRRKEAPAKKHKSEGGIFGTSWEVGFTKQNELLLGKIAMMGFAVSLLGEAVTGQGMLSHLHVQTGVTLGEADLATVLFIMGSLMGAVGAFGDRGRFVEEDDPLHKYGESIRGILGRDDSGTLLSGLGKEEQLFVGRIAQLGLATSLMGELLSGKGVLAQLNLATGLPLNHMEPFLLLSIFVLFAAASNTGHGRFTMEEEESLD